MPTSVGPSRRALFPLAASAWAAASTRAAAQAVRGVTESEITLGSTMALTGPLASNGLSIRAGATAVVNEVNGKGGVNGRKLRLISEDNAYSAPQGLAAVRKMVSTDGIFALVVPHATPQTAAAIPYLAQQKVPIFATYGGLPDWYYPPRPGLFGLYPLGDDQGRAVGRWAAKEGHKKALVLYIEGSTYLQTAQESEKAFRAEGGEAVELQGVKFSTSDYAPVAIKIAQTKPDVLIVCLSEFETVLLAREMRNQNLRTPIYGWVPVVTQNLTQVGAAAVEGIKAVSLAVSPSTDSPAIKEYLAALAKHFPSEKPEFFSLFAFASMKVFVEALSRMKGAATQDELVRALESIKDYDGGILPPVTFGPDRHQGTTSFFEAQIVNGAWKMGALITGQA